MAIEQKIAVDEKRAPVPTLPSEPARPQPVTVRAVLTGLACAMLVCGITPYNDYDVGATYLSGNFFPIGALAAILLLVLLVNPVLIASGRQHRVFSPGEIITVWAMVITAAGVPSSGLMRYLLPHIVAPYYYASNLNRWNDLFLSHLPRYLFVTDPMAVRTFFEGLQRGQAVPWGAWAVPLACWSLFVACLFLSFFCLSALLRKPWVENERLAFPLVKLPMLLAEEPAPGQKFNALLRNPLLWVGFGLVSVVHTTKGLHQIYPTIPDIMLAWHTSTYLHGRIWDGLGDTAIFVWPLVIGFSYLMSSEVCLSLWLFYLVFKAQVLAGILYDWNMDGIPGYAQGPAFTVYPEVGGAVMLVLWCLWTMRAHLSDVWRKAIGKAPEIDDSREAQSYRFAFFGLIFGYLGMFLWLVIAAKMQAVMAFGILTGSLVVFIMLSWLVAQAGLLFVTQAFAPSQITTVFMGSAAFDARSLVMSSLTEHIGWQDSREFMMPPLLNSLKGAAETGLSARSLSRALALCVVLAVVLSGAVSIWLPYTHGGALGLNNPWMYNWAPCMSFQWANSQVAAPQPPQTPAMLQMLGGAVFVLMLFVCRSYAPALGLHPAGFLVAASYALYELWFSLFLGWAIKTPIVRYGGMRGYRAAMPFFLGLILGDCVNALVWVVIGLTTGKGYQLMPG